MSLGRLHRSCLPEELAWSVVHGGILLPSAGGCFSASPVVWVPHHSKLVIAVPVRVVVESVFRVSGLGVGVWW